jgi:hypothetical protein
LTSPARAISADTGRWGLPASWTRKPVVAAAHHRDRVRDLADLARGHHLAALAFALHADVFAGDVAVGAEAEAALPGQDGEGLRRRRRLLDGLLHVEAAQEHARPFGMGDGGVPGIAVERQQRRDRDRGHEPDELHPPEHGYAPREGKID